MSESRKDSSCDVDALLKELENEEVPAMSREFEAQAMDRIVRRKNELDTEETGTVKIQKSRRILKAWIAAAAVLVFLLGGTLLTRGSLRGNVPDSGNPPVVHAMPYNPFDETPEKEQDKPQNEAVLFLEDMWLFLKASLPWLGGAGGVAIVLYCIKKKT